MEKTVLKGMNVLMNHIHVHLMLHVQTQLDPTLVHVILATREVEELALISMNVMMGHIHVHPMLHVQTQ